jgi:Domain of unknown function (DUF4153)
MSETSARSWWRNRLPDLSAAATRFPLALVLAGILTAYQLYYDSPGVLQSRIVGALAASFLWVVAVDFYVESQRRPLAARIALWLAGILVIGLLFWLAWEVWLFQPLLLGALLILVGLAGHLGRSESNDTFWLFNHKLWLGALLGLAGACLFGIGLSIIIKTLNLLFGLDLSSRWYEYTWTVSLGFVAPVSFLAFAPRGFTDPITAREEGEFTFRAAAVLVKFVLVPLLLVYTAILYAYAIKIALAWELPKGTLGGMVVGYLLVGAATLLVGYPTRDVSGPHVRFFWRYWVWLAALPVVLLFIAVWRRIRDYGLTEDRYVMVLIGVWALILCGLRIIKGKTLDLRLVPGVLALLLAASSFGPGGASGFSVMSQKAELAEILTAKGMLAGGKFVPSSAETPLGHDGARARDIQYYLNTHHALDMIAPWFAGQPDDPFAPGETPDETTRKLLLALGLRPDLRNATGVVYFTHYSDVPATIAPAKSARVIGPIVFQSIRANPGPIPPQTVAVEGLGDVRLGLAENVLSVSVANGDRVDFNIIDAVKEIYRRGWPKTEDHRPLVLTESGQGLSGTAVIDNMNGAYKDPDFSLSLLRVWLVLSQTN